MLRVILIFVGLVLSAYAHAQGVPQSWKSDWTNGSTDVNGKFTGGTETRALAYLNGGSTTAFGSCATPNSGAPQLFASNSYWMDTPGGEGTQNSQVLVKNGPGCAWQQDVNFGSFCPADVTLCALATSALDTVQWDFDSGGNPVTVTTLLAATWWRTASPGGLSSITCDTSHIPVLVYAKNNADKLWYQTVLACEPTGGDGDPQVRSFGGHDDQVVASTSYAFMGEGPTGIWACQLNTVRSAGNNPLVCPTGLGNQEFSTSVNPATPVCNRQARIMAFAEATGADGVTREYASSCWFVYVRIDGPQSTCTNVQVKVGGICQARWQLYWTDNNNGNSQSGIRGLTKTGETCGGASNCLILGEEGTTSSIWRLQPYDPTNCPLGISGAGSCAHNEYGFISNANNVWACNPGYTISPYNRFDLWWDKGGTGRRIAGQSSFITAGCTTPPTGYSFSYFVTGQGKVMAQANYTFRPSSGTENLQTITPTITPSTPLGAIRQMILSPFPTECYGATWPNNCATYWVGYDAQGQSTYCWNGTTSCTSFVNTHGTGYIFRFGY